MSPEENDSRYSVFSAFIRNVYNIHANKVDGKTKG